LEKILSPIGPAVLEKKEENLSCFGKNGILRITQKNFFVLSFSAFAHFEPL
jgi:hypothetical protein